MKTLLLLGALLVLSTSAFAGMGITRTSLNIALVNDSTTTEDLPIRNSDRVYELVPKSSLAHFLRSVYERPGYTAEVNDCDDNTAIFIGEFKRFMLKTNPATTGGYAIGKIYSFERKTGTFHVDSIVMTERGTYVVLTQLGKIAKLDNYEKKYKTHRIEM